MAHLGRKYPVHFRRDFNVNCNATTPGAIPKGIRIQLRSNVSPAYPVDFQSFDCPTVPSGDVSALEWISDDRRISGHDWHVRITLRYNQVPDTFLLQTWELYRDGALASRWRPNDATREPFFKTTFQPAWQVLYTDFAVFPAGANFNYSFANPIGHSS